MQSVTAVTRAAGMVKREATGNGWEADACVIRLACRDAGAVCTSWAQCTQDVSCGRGEFAGTERTPRKWLVRLAMPGWCAARRHVSTVRESDTARINEHGRQFPCVVCVIAALGMLSLCSCTASGCYTTNQVKCNNVHAAEGIACCAANAEAEAYRRSTVAPLAPSVR